MTLVEPQLYFCWLCRHHSYTERLGACGKVQRVPVEIKCTHVRTTHYPHNGGILFLCSLFVLNQFSQVKLYRMMNSRSCTYLSCTNRQRIDMLYRDIHVIP